MSAATRRAAAKTGHQQPYADGRADGHTPISQLRCIVVTSQKIGTRVHGGGSGTRSGDGVHERDHADGVGVALSVLSHR